MKKTVIALLFPVVAAVPVFAADTIATPASAPRDTQAEEIETLTYAPGENSLNASARSRLQAWAQHLAGKPKLRVEITGHTDERLLTLRARAIFSDNLGISNVRAKEVAEVLRAQAGFAEAVITAVGKGDTEPKVSCKRKASARSYLACLEPNRRVEIHVRYDNEAVAVDIAPAPEPVTVEAAPAPAVAEIAPVAAPRATEEIANNGYYAALDFGKVSYSNTAGQYDGAAFPNPAILRIGGGYRFTPRLAVEAGYSLIGDSSIKSTSALVLTETLRNTNFQLTAVGTYPINDTFGVFGKLGLSYTKLDYGYASATTSGSGSGSKVNPMYGLGAQYNINKHHSLRAQYENFGKTAFAANFSDGTTATSTIGVAVISAGWMYNF
jgi:OOP family OmpA-OmpF porin